VHETIADHVLSLPTQRLLPERDFGGQRFVRHVAAEAPWAPWRWDGFEMRDIGIGAATDGLAGARVVRPLAGSAAANLRAHGGEFLFLFVLKGEIALEMQRHGAHRLAASDSCVIPAGAGHALRAEAGSEILEVTLPAELTHA
jgi:mannose-6-phosphate isomerase-like protein (cupin superfamily)